jgi:hypothetical protein
MTTERMLIWEGTSLLDGVTHIEVLATGVPKAGGLGRKSANVKTGDMIQIAIMVAQRKPLLVLQAGDDQAVCGTCPHRGKPSGGTGTCYVNLGQGPRSTMTSHITKGSVPFDLERFRGQKVRFGSYGDPAAVPVEVWLAIAEVADGFTGYTHQWRTCRPEFAQVCMASVDSQAEAAQAITQGYRVFWVRPFGSDKPEGMITCPASAEAGKRTVCADCMMCGGTASKQVRSITIQAHGATKSSFQPAEV